MYTFLQIFKTVTIKMLLYIELHLFKVRNHPTLLWLAKTIGTSGNQVVYVFYGKTIDVLLKLLLGCEKHRKKGEKKQKQ